MPLTPAITNHDPEPLRDRVVPITGGAQDIGREVLRRRCSALAKAHGSIVDIASTCALQSEPDSGACAASQGGLPALTHAMAIGAGPNVRSMRPCPDGLPPMPGAGPPHDGHRNSAGWITHSIRSDVSARRRTSAR